LLFVFVFAEIHDLADRRIGVGRNLDKVKAGFERHLKRLGGCYQSNILAICSDEANFTGRDAVIDPWSGVARGRRVVWSASYDFDPSMVPANQFRKVNGTKVCFKREYRQFRAEKQDIASCVYFKPAPFDPLSECAGQPDLGRI
jgi:hypothetical protein